MDRDITNGQPSVGTGGGISGAAGEALPAVSIPDHQLLQCIGRGSYGEVWLARNSMGVYRAVKIVYRKAFENERPFQRELSGIRKFEPISRSHEGFIDVLHVGINEAEGYFYYVMELGDDQSAGQNFDPADYLPRTLGKEISIHGRLPFQECLQLGLALSLALEELHKRGLVHRDVKPSNIIFVNGVPKLADIGLVADMDEARSYVGTEGFIPPEGPGTPQADVYSLGKVLYEASTGKDRQMFPELPTRLNTSAEPDGFWELNEVILQACRNDLAGRYRSAWDMHADLLVLANGKSVKRLKTLERRLANIKRVAGIMALVVLVLAAVFYQIYREWRNAREARERQVGANVAYGNRALETGDLLDALPYFAEALKLDDPKKELTHRLRLGSVLAECPKLSAFWALGDYINDGQFSPDGKTVLAADYISKVKVLDANSGKVLPYSFGSEAGVNGVAFSRDGRFAVACGRDNTVGIWETSGYKIFWQLPPHPEMVWDARFSPDGRKLVTCCVDGVARVWDISTRRIDFTMRHSDSVLFVDYSPDGRFIVTTCADRTARIWDASDGHPVGAPVVHPSLVTSVAFSPDGQKMVTASDHQARVWEFPGCRRILPDLNHRDMVNAAEFSPDGQLIVTAANDGTTRLWNAADLSPLASNPVIKVGARVTQATFDPDGHRILMTCTDGTVQIWDLAGITVPSIRMPKICSPDGNHFLNYTTNRIEAWHGPLDKPADASIVLKSPLLAIRLNRDGSVVAGDFAVNPNPNQTNYIVHIWNTVTGKLLGPEICISNQLFDLTLSEDGRRLATLEDRAVTVWDTVAGTPLFPRLAFDTNAETVCFSPDASRIAIGVDHRAKVFDSLSGRHLYTTPDQSVQLELIRFSRDGSRMITCCSDVTLSKCNAQVWDAATGQPIGQPLKHNDGVLDGSFSPDGRRVVTASEDYTAVVWDAATGEPVVPAFDHDHQVKAASFSPDGKWVVTASLDKGARIWNVETGDLLTPPLRHVSGLVRANFLADGRHVFTRESNGNGWLWTLPVDERPADDLLDIARLLSGGNVTRSRQMLSSPSSPSRLLPDLWEHLRNKYPATFTVSPEDIAAWHEFQAEACESGQQWAAAIFHLERLQRLRPDDPSLSGRLALAKKKLRD
jgi:WD40 repeat protein